MRPRKRRPNRRMNQCFSNVLTLSPNHFRMHHRESINVHEKLGGSATRTVAFALLDRSISHTSKVASMMSARNVRMSQPGRTIADSWVFDENHTGHSDASWVDFWLHVTLHIVDKISNEWQIKFSLFTDGCRRNLLCSVLYAEKSNIED